MNNGTLPNHGIKRAVGYDISAVEDVVIPGRGKGTVGTSIAVFISLHTYSRIAPPQELTLNGILTWVQVL